MSQASVAQWIQKRLVQVPTPTKFSLRHKNVETGESELVQRVEVSAGDPSQVAKDLARDLYDMAKDHCGAWPGRPQLYTVTALVKNKSEGTFSFRTRVEGRSSDLALAEGSEPPTPAGIAAQHMRFTEAAIRIALEANAEVIDSLRGENKELRAERERDQARRIEFITLHEEMLDRRAERELDIQKFEDQRNRKNLMLGKVIENVMPSVGQKIPALIDAMLGAGPTKNDILKKVFSIFSALPDDKREDMLRALPAEARKDLEELVDAMATQQGSQESDGGGVH